MTTTTKKISVQPKWCKELPLQQQSVLLLATRGPDGIAKFHACKLVQTAYRACTLVAAKYGRSLNYGERADTFMSLDIFADEKAWATAVQAFLDHIDSLPFHYVTHFAHGVEILGYKHPEPQMRQRWHIFYLAIVNHMHLEPETEKQMDKRLGDWERRHW